MAYKRLKMIFTTAELDRLTFNESIGELRITADVHGMKCRGARRFINNIINTVRIAFILIVIHGYNHGTAIRDMLYTKFKSPHITNQHLAPLNQGVTIMTIAK